MADIKRKYTATFDVEKEDWDNIFGKEDEKVLEEFLEEEESEKK